MGSKHLKPFAILAMGIILLSSCGIPDKDKVPTQLAGDIVLLTAQGAAAATLTQQALLIPTSTNTPEATATLTPTVFTTPSPTISSAPMLSVSKDTNCRTGQGIEFDKVGGLFVGTMAEIVGVDSTGGYFYIRNPDNPQGYCWIVNTFVILDGDISYLPRFTPMPEPTLAPTGTAGPTFGIVSAKLDTCDPNNWFEIVILNNGNSILSSGSVAVFDSDNLESIPANPVNDFVNHDGCVSGSSQGDLAVGESGYIQSPTFSFDPSGHEITLTINLCTEDDLGGTCTEKVYIFTPQ